MQSREPEWQGAVFTPARAQPPGLGSPLHGGQGQRSQQQWGTLPRVAVGCRPPPLPGPRGSAQGYLLPHPPAGVSCALGPHWVSGTSAGPGPGSGRGQAAPGRSAPCLRAGGGGGGGGDGAADASGPWADPAPGLGPLMAGPQTGWSCSGLSPSLGQTGSDR